jgi:hypothetical protein
LWALRQLAPQLVWLLACCIAELAFKFIARNEGSAEHPLIGIVVSVRSPLTGLGLAAAAALFTIV